MYILYIILFSAALLLGQGDTEPAYVWSENYMKARKSAIELNRPYVIVFEKKDCAPCREMKQEFKKPAIQSVMQQSFIGLAVDVDDFEGQTLKKYYQVESLPALILFSAKGHMLHRYNQLLSEKQLLKVLMRPTEDVFSSSSQSKSTEEKVSSIQVGVFSKASKALDFRNRLQRICSAPPYITKEDGQHKVVLGPFEKQKVETLQKELDTYGYTYQILPETRKSGKNL